MKIQLETISPKRAEELLKNVDNAYQRRLMPRIVANYAQSMKAGHWVTSPQGIALDNKNRLVDGQHRLQAIVKSGVTILLPVAYDVPEIQNGTRLIDILDSGKARSVGQQLALSYGYTGNGNIVAAACRGILIGLIRGKFPNTTPVAVKVLETYGSEMQFCIEHMTPIIRLRSGYVMAGFAIALANKRTKGAVEELYVSTMTGERLKRKDPAFTLRNHLLMGKQLRHATGGSSTAIRTISMITLAAMHQVEGNKVENLRYSEIGLDFFRSKQLDRVQALSKACGF